MKMKEEHTQGQAQYWKFGILYYNKEDARLFPPKRNPHMGWTVNFAHRKAVWIFIALLLFPIILVFITICLTKKIA